MMVEFSKENLEQLLASYENNGHKFGNIGSGWLFDYAYDRDKQIDALRAQVATLEAERDAALAHIHAITTGTDDLVTGADTLRAIVEDFRAIHVDDVNTTRNLRERIVKLLGELQDERQDRALAETHAAAAKATMKQQQAINALSDDKATIGELLALLHTMRDLVVSGAGDDAWEALSARKVYARALELIGAVPPGDVSDPAWGGGLAPLDATKRAADYNAAQDAQSENE